MPSTNLSHTQFIPFDVFKEFPLKALTLQKFIQSNNPLRICTKQEPLQEFIRSL